MARLDAWTTAQSGVHDDSPVFLSRRTDHKLRDSLVIGISHATRTSIGTVNPVVHV